MTDGGEVDCPDCKTTIPSDISMPDGSNVKVQFCPVCGGLQDGLETDGGQETTTACPNCDSARLTRRVKTNLRKRWRCKDCEARFDEAVERVSENTNQSTHGPARRLEQMDPDDLGDGLVTDGGREFLLGDVSAFQRDLLTAIGALEQDGETPTTSGMVDVLDAHYSVPITRGRLSRNLDELSRRGMIDVEPVDGRTNAYILTDFGHSVLRDQLDLLEQAVSSPELVTDGGERKASDRALFGKMGVVGIDGNDYEEANRRNYVTRIGVDHLQRVATIFDALDWNEIDIYAVEGDEERSNRLLHFKPAGMGVLGTPDAGISVAPKGTTPDHEEDED
jgi:ribosomal protein L37AE/L43A/DNA-binding PadR family transcriptional regulator